MTMTQASQIAQAKDQATIAQLKALGFSDDKIETPRRIVGSLSGREKTGKTHFALTATPPIIFINVDIGTEGVVNKFQDDKQILIYDVRIPQGANKDVYVPLWEEIKKIFRKVYTLNKGTVVVDTDSEIYELARLAKFGKLSQVMPQHYAEVNSEYRELLRLAYDSSMNSLFIHKMKPRYINNARTNEYDPAGFADMSYLAQINLITYREDTDDGPEFSVYIKDCRQNPNIGGDVLRGPMCNFDFLLGLVHDK